MRYMTYDALSLEHWAYFRQDNELPLESVPFGTTNLKALKDSCPKSAIVYSETLNSAHSYEVNITRWTFVVL